MDGSIAWRLERGTEGYAYILVHQTGLADTAVAQDDDLFTAIRQYFEQLECIRYTEPYRLTLRRTFFLEDMLG